MCTFFVGDLMDNKYLDLAYRESLKAKDKNEVPVGAVIVCDGKVISKAYNKKVSTNNVCAHAEMIAIRKASLKLNDWRLNGCELYVTLEPCPMCAGAIEQSRIDKVYIGARSNFDVNREIISRIFDNDEFYHRVEYEYLDSEKCSNILKEFFLSKRKKSK